MTDNEKELVATIKLSLLRAIVDLNEETIAMAIKVPKSEEPSEDCVSRKAMLDAITEIDDNINMDIYTNEVREIIENLPPVTPTQRWIPVSERLPKEMGTYMTTIDYGEHGLVTGQRYYYGRGLKWNDECVIAWMPLPKPYKAEMESE